jgi:hypothetical protein
MKFILNKPKDQDKDKDKEYQNLFLNLDKYGENITTKEFDDNFIEFEIHLFEEVEISKFKSYIKQSDLFYSFFKL